MEDWEVIIKAILLVLTSCKSNLLAEGQLLNRLFDINTSHDVGVI